MMRHSPYKEEVVVGGQVNKTQEYDTGEQRSIPM